MQATEHRLAPLPQPAAASARLDVIEILHDRQRLKNAMAVVNEGGHQMLRVHFGITGIELAPGQNVDFDFLEREPLQRKCNTDAECRIRAPESVELNCQWIVPFQVFSSER
jgi:hypothetical protein